MDYGYYDYGYDVGSTVATGFGVALGIIAFVCILSIAISIFMLVCLWKVYKKAGKKGWETLIPIYNNIVLLEIANLPMWYLILFFIPVGNIVVLFLIYLELAKKFGQSSAFGIGLVFLTPIFMAILAFSKNCVYQLEPTLGQNTTVTYANENPQSTEQPVEQSTHPNNCPGCGAPVDADDKFCMYCGKQL